MDQRPEPFCAATVRELWTDPHISEHMLRAHIDKESDLASPRHAFIERACVWIAEHFKLDETKSIVDFGCGPGLWCQRLASSGAHGERAEVEIRRGD